MRGRPPGSKNKEVPAAPDLLVIPRRIKKEIGTLSLASGVSPAQVLVDILAGGLINAREMYRTLIEYRKSLHEQLNENGGEPVEELREDSSNGSDDVRVVTTSDVVEVLSIIQPTGGGPDLAAVGPGLGTEGYTPINGDRGVDDP